MQAIILASGRGTRFRPITDSIPKPLLPLANRPLLEYLLSSLAQAGCTKIFVSVGYAGDQIQQFLTAIQPLSSVTPVFASNWHQGPLASFQAVIPHLFAQDPFILVPADLYISPTDLRSLTSTTSEMALLYDSGKKQPGTLIQVNATHQIHDLLQSSRLHPGYYTGVPALRANPKFLSYSLKASSTTQSTIFDLLQDWLSRGHTIQGIPATGKAWCDIDTPAQLLEFNHHLLTDGWPPDPVPLGTYLPEGTTMAGPIQRASLVLGHGSEIRGPVLLGPHVQVGENCIIRNGTALGASTIIDDNSELVQCITFPHTQVPSNVDLKAAILDAKGNIVHSH